MGSKSPSPSSKSSARMSAAMSCATHAREQYGEERRPEACRRVKPESGSTERPQPKHGPDALESGATL